MRTQNNEYLYMTAFHNRPSIYLRVVESADGDFEQELQWVVDSIRKGVLLHPEQLFIWG